jgi:hypothetical protein
MLDLGKPALANKVTNQLRVATVAVDATTEKIDDSGDKLTWQEMSF